jgi:hypothetical protein
MPSSYRHVLVAQSLIKSANCCSIDLVNRPLLRNRQALLLVGVRVLHKNTTIPGVGICDWQHTFRLFAQLPPNLAERREKKCTMQFRISVNNFELF